MTPAEPRQAPTIMLVAGEASGDLHGASLSRALRLASPGARLLGMGGAGMAAAGVELIADIRDSAVVGLSEVFRRLPELRRIYRRLVSALTGERPDVLVLIDYPGMNLRLAGVARRLGVPVVYFIPPQIWAWRPGRLRTIRDRVALVLAVLPFERALYARAGVPAEFVGHPLLDALAAAPERGAARRELGLDDRALVIGLLPGSRYQEIERMTPLLRDAATRIRAVQPQAQFVVGLAPSVERGEVTRHLAGDRTAWRLTDRTYAAMRASDLLLATSGTVTLEAALLGTPMVVCYRVSRLSEWVAQRVVRVPWISLPNIVLGRAVVPELIRRRDASAGRLAQEALRLLDTPGALDAQRGAFKELAVELGEPGVGARAARLILSISSGTTAKRMVAW